MMFYYLHSISVVHVNIVSANLTLCLPPKSGDTSLMHWLYELHTSGRQWDDDKCTHLYDPEYRGGSCWLEPGKLRFGRGRPAQQLARSRHPRPSRPGYQRLEE